MTMTKPNDPVEIINHMVLDEAPVTIFLTTGIKLQGKLVGISHLNNGAQEMFLLEREGKPMVVMAHAVSSILPA